MSGTVSFLAGSAAGGYGTGSDMSTGFTLERSIFSDGHLSFSGDVGYGSSLPAGVLRTTYSHRLADGSAPTLGLTVRRFSPSDPNLHNAALQALALSAGDDFTVADVLELKFGSELQTVQFLGHATAFRPYGSADLHLSPNTVLEYDYATSRPDLRAEKGFDSSPADLSESNPRISLLGFAPKMESAHHHEVSLSRRVGKNNLQVAAYLRSRGRSRPSRHRRSHCGRRIPFARHLLRHLHLCRQDARYRWPPLRAAAQVLRRPYRHPRLRFRRRCSIYPSPTWLCSRRSNFSPPSAAMPLPPS